MANINVVRDMVRPKRRIAPDPRAHELCMELYDQYTHLYRILGDSFREISRTQAGLVGKSSRGRHAMRKPEGLSQYSFALLKTHLASSGVNTYMRWIDRSSAW